MNFYLVLPTADSMPDKHYVMEDDKVTYVAQGFTNLDEAKRHAETLEQETGIPQEIHESEMKPRHKPEAVAVHRRICGEWVKVLCE